MRLEAIDTEDTDTQAMSITTEGMFVGRTRRLCAIVAGAALSAVIVVGVGAAPEAFAVAGPPVADGVYIDGPGWSAPDSDIWVGSTGPGCAASGMSVMFKGEGNPVALDRSGRGEARWAVEDGFHIPASAGGVGSVVITCLVADSSPISVSIPFTVSATAPASIYHTPAMWTMLGPDQSRAVTVNKVGYLPGESVRVTIYDQNIYNSSSDLTQAMTDPVTVVADGTGAITAQIVAPGSWGSDSVQAIISSATSQLVFDTSGDNGVVTSDEMLTSNASVNAGESVAVSGTGYAAGESVVIALHSATNPALVLSTVIASGTGAVSGSIAVPSSVVPGTYRLWAGSKTSGYALQNVPLTVNPSGSGTFADVVASSPFFTYVGWMAAQGISTGTVQSWGKPMFKPLDAVSRQAMALFMYRLSGETFSPPTASTFADVAPGTQFFTAVEWMASRGISVGTVQSSGTPLFKPTDAVSRQAMALFLARYAHVNVSVAPTAPSFADVTLDAPAAAAVKWMKDMGLSTGTVQAGGLPLYKPADPVSRQAMAAFLYRLAHLSGQS